MKPFTGFKIPVRTNTVKVFINVRKHAILTFKGFHVAFLVILPHGSLKLTESLLSFKLPLIFLLPFIGAEHILEFLINEGSNNIIGNKQANHDFLLYSAESGAVARVSTSLTILIIAGTHILSRENVIIYDTNII
jgi:hypothetical protein